MSAFAGTEPRRVRGRTRYPIALFAAAAILAVPSNAQSPVQDILAFRFTLAGAAAAGPVAEAGRVWIVSEDRTLYILDDSGRAVGRRAWRDGSPAWIAPDPFGRALLPAADGSLVMVNRAGLEVWRVRPGVPVVRAPAFGADGRFFAAAASRLLAWSASGRLLWSVEHAAPIAAGPSVRFTPSGKTRVTLALADGSIREYAEDGTLLSSVPDGTSSSVPVSEPPSALCGIGEGFVLAYRNGAVSVRDGAGQETYRVRLAAPVVAAAGDRAEAWLLLAGGSVVRVREGGTVSDTTSTGILDAQDIRVFPERVLVLGPRGAASLAKDGQVYRALSLRHAPRMPAVTSSGIVLSAGEDWILYAYRFEGPLGEPARPAPGYVDFAAARARANEEIFWNPGFGDDAALRELRRIEKSLGSASIGAEEGDALLLCSAIALGYGAREASVYGGAAPRGPRPSGALPRALACDILGMLGSPRAVPVLTEAYLRDPEPAVRASAARAIGIIGLDLTGEALRAFQGAADREFFLDEPGALATIDAVEGIYRALGELSDPGGVRAVLRLADKPYGSAVRSRALAALRRLSEPAR
ncbi:MAG TPA: HEAT repeat domain-containing protein [Spirochaetia bacterium]|nr:HEAT repeat domain-containing protein [Spirochaetales bacterium]HRY80614.1 HEAT repeat domain-containing protein [Spirochaetia bacterium]